MNDLAARVVGGVWNAVAGGAFCEARLREILGNIVTDPHFDHVMQLAGEPVVAEMRLAAVDGELDSGYRKLSGAYFTPPELADIMSEWLDDADVVADPSCGAGELLLAVIRRQDRRVIGVEQDALVAFVAAARIRLVSDRNDHQIVWGDGLAWDQLPQDAAIVSNPPYLGEKGNKAHFDSLRKTFPGFAQYFVGRGDLFYAFMRRALDVLSDGSRAVFLTSEYWLTADSAEGLRDDLARRSHVVEMHQLGANRFPQAPGHHSLITVFDKGEPKELSRSVDQDGVRRTWSTSQSVWTPFSDQTSVRGQVLFSDVARDFQGFVSGADDRFICDHDNLADSERQSGLFRPVLRARDCVPNRVFLTPPEDHDWVLWLDDEVEGDALQIVEERLLGAKTKLERRREVQNGRMPWYRIHWPRKAADQLAPKLVVPRRAKTPRFCLDLSGSAVSSDCTYIIVDGSLEKLVELMVILNSENTLSHLQHFGKRKGDILEFYSSPLREIPVGDFSEVILQEILAERATAAFEALRKSRSNVGILDI